MTNFKESLDSDSLFKEADGFASAFDETLNSAEDFLTGEELTIEHIRSLSTTTPEAYRSVQQSESEEHMYVQEQPLAFNGGDQDALRISTDYGGLTKNLGLEEPSSMNAVGKSLDLSNSSSSSIAKLAAGQSEYDSFSRARRKKSNLPRVAMLASTPPKKPVAEKKNTPPPFRAGGKIISNTPPSVRSPLSHRVTPPQKRSTELSPKGNMREPSSSNSLRSPGTKSTRSLSSSKDYSAQGDSSISRRHTTGSSQISPTRNGSMGRARESGSTRRIREIAKPPENITRAIKESQELSKMEQDGGEQDLEIDHLKTLMDDIKELKNELGVPTEVAGDTGEGEALAAKDSDNVSLHADNQAEKEPSPRKQSIELQVDDSVENRSSSSKDFNPGPPMKSPFEQGIEAELQGENPKVEADPVVKETLIPKKQLCGCCVM
eukprot:jgi/Picsp_1/571/NSC_00568-R1_---NA---